MKTLILALVLLTQTAQANPRNIPDLPPDSSSAMYKAHLDSRMMMTGEGSLTVADGLDSIVRLGERNLEWLNYINSFRPANNKLSLTSKETQRGIPIDKPSEYNVPLVKQKLEDLRPQMPAEMQKVIFENAAFTKEPPVPLQDYLKWSLELDRVYQSALRWRTMAPWLSYLAQERHNDLRGWYFLTRLEGRADKLAGFSKLPDAEKAKIQDWFVNLCYNTDTSSTITNCVATVTGIIERGQSLEAYFQKQAPSSEAIFRKYFDISSMDARPEVRWEGGASPRIVAPFQDPSTPEVRSFLQDNIQDEWHFGNWHLELPFDTSRILPKVVFESGATPHVNGLGGDTITMNAEQPLTEYDAQWTIRHEYGHVLGFPDCYVEFYEKERGVIVNYQFDIEDLMCSRRGHIKAHHVDQLKRVYSR